VLAGGHNGILFMKACTVFNVEQGAIRPGTIPKRYRWPARAVLRKTRVPTTPVERISDDDSILLEADVRWSVVWGLENTHPGLEPTRF
jgi:hypothetical protein